MVECSGVSIIALAIMRAPVSPPKKAPDGLFFPCGYSGRRLRKAHCRPGRSPPWKCWRKPASIAKSTALIIPPSPLVPEEILLFLGPACGHRHIASPHRRDIFQRSQSASSRWLRRPHARISPDNDRGCLPHPKAHRYGRFPDRSTHNRALSISQRTAWSSLL